MHEAEGNRCPLGDVADTNPETLPGNTPPSTRFRYIDLSAVEAGFINWGAVAETTFGSAPSRARRIVRASDVLFGTVRPNLKSHGFIGPDEPGPLVASTGFSVVRARDGLSHPSYLFHSLMSSLVTAQAVRNAIGSSYPALNDSDVKHFQIFVPPLREQQKTAQVLDTLDTAIHESEAVIAKLKALKQGLLHELLTRGIDANGELRPPQAEAPQLYKQSPLGWIPKKWEVRSLASLGTYENGYAFSDAHWSEHGLPIVRIAQITGSQAVVDRYPGNLPARFLIGDGDLIFSWSGTLVVVRWNGGPAWLNQHLFKVTPSQNVDSSFMFHVLQASVEEMKKRTHGSTMKHIKRGELASYFVALPNDRDEQVWIADRLDACDESFRQNSTALASLRDLRSGLMDDLLTGRVRVTPLLAEADREKECA